MRAVGLIPIDRDALGAISIVQRVHAIDADEKNVLNLAASLRGGRGREQAHARESNQPAGEKSTIDQS